MEKIDFLFNQMNNGSYRHVTGRDSRVDFAIAHRIIGAWWSARHKHYDLALTAVIVASAYETLPHTATHHRHITMADRDCHRSLSPLGGVRHPGRAR